MTEDQAAKIIEVIRIGADNRGGYFSTGGTSCVLGSLWLAAGRARGTFLRASPVYDDMIGVLEEYYGMSWRQAAEIGGINDAYDQTGDRREALIRLVESWIT